MIGGRSCAEVPQAREAHLTQGPADAMYRCLAATDPVEHRVVRPVRSPVQPGYKGSERALQHGPLGREDRPHAAGCAHGPGASKRPRANAPDRGDGDPGRRTIVSYQIREITWYMSC
jgi:hypothetical protein